MMNPLAEALPSHKIIEKYQHQLTAGEMIFYLWLCSKYPQGVNRSSFYYPNVHPNTASNYISKLIRYKIITSTEKRITPCP